MQRWYVMMLASFKLSQDANTNIMNMGTMLEIKPVTQATAGQYRCQGVNEATIKTMNYEYQVTVKCKCGSSSTY